MTIEFKLPDLGENVEQADVVSVLVGEGHVIQPGQNVLELETDKAVVELPSTHGGRVTKVHVKNGDKVRVGDTILTIEEEARQGARPAAAATAPAPESQAEQVAEEPARIEEHAPEEKPQQKAGRAAAERETEEQSRQQYEEEFGSVPTSERMTQAPETRPPTPSSRPAPQPAPAPANPPETQARQRPVPAGPATRRMARELGVDLHQVSGTGPGGRIVEEDIKAYVREMQLRAAAGGAGTVAAPPLPDFAQWGPVERQPMGGIRRKTAENTSLAWRMAPHVTQFDQADITELEAARKQYQNARKDQPGKVTMTVLAIKAVVAALKQFPQFNSSVDGPGGALILKRYYHIGIAVDTDNGLLVPVIRDADRKSVLELARELEDTAEKARQRKLGIAEMQGGTFTITNLGGIGGTNFTPVIHYPEVAILGMARAAQMPVVRNGAIEIRTIMPLGLSYDHRAIDGADGAQFMRYLVEMFSDPMKLLLEG